MEFLADQTIPTPSIEEIRALGNTVEVVDAESASNRGDILERAIRDDRVLLTFEIEYYERIFEEGQPSPTGIVCFQMDWETPRDPANVLAAVLTDDDVSVDGQFSLLERERMRQRPLETDTE